MGDKLLVHFLLFIVIATALLYFGGVGVEEQVVVSSDIFANSLLDFGDCKGIMEVFR